MARLTWSPRARGDLRDIRRYIARDSRQHAAQFVERLLTAAERLQTYPLMGRVVPEDTRGELREILALGYRIIYYVSEGDAEIVMVVHGARRLTDMPGR